MTQPVCHSIPLEAVPECLTLNLHRVISQKRYDGRHMHDLG